MCRAPVLQKGVAGPFRVAKKLDRPILWILSVSKVLILTLVALENSRESFEINAVVLLIVPT